MYIQVLGYQRTLQASDLYKMDPSQESGVLAAQLEAAWQRRVQAAADWNARLESGELSPTLLMRTTWALRAISSKGEKQASTWSERCATFQTRWRESEGLRQASLTWALNDVFHNMFWIAGVFKARVLSTIVTVMINLRYYLGLWRYSTTHESYHH
jgi:ATP-binding cassette subfamily C (CFTR/MRP) protein 1